MFVHTDMTDHMITQLLHIHEINEINLLFFYCAILLSQCVMWPQFPALMFDALCIESCTHWL